MKNKVRVNYHSMSVLAVIVGVAGVASQFLVGWEPLSFMLTLAALGGLIGGSDSYEQEERLQLERSYKPAFEWLLLVVLSLYAIIELAKWLHFTDPVIFLNGHWPGVMIAMMCVFMGIAGLRKRRG
jgi:hypothetical protein